MQAKPAIVLYEDDHALAGEIIRAFSNEGHDVALACTEAEFLGAAHAAKPCILIMDRLIHGTDSLILLEAIRAAGNRTPVMVISSLNSVDDRISGLRTGGDDYLVKPFAMSELVARVEALARRAADKIETTLAVGDLVMDIVGRTVRRNNRSLTLAPREFSLLEYLMRHPGQIVTRSMILEGVWKYRGALKTNVVDVHISNLRRKVDAEGEPQLIKNRRGLGFTIAANEE